MLSTFLVEINYSPKEKTKERESISKKLSKLTKKCGGSYHTSYKNSFYSSFSNINQVDKFSYFAGEILPGKDIHIINSKYFK
jgi:hypothetical protein